MYRQYEAEKESAEYRWQVAKGQYIKVRNKSNSLRKVLGRARK